MENIPNGAFDKRFLSFPQSQYSTVLNQIISGIDFLHSNSIIHRDIKLENILYNEEKGTIKIIDFGLSKVLFPSETTSECCGTVSYSAPEIIEGKPYTKTVDIWSFGILAYIFKYKKKPFDNEEFDKDTINRKISTFLRYSTRKILLFGKKTFSKELFIKHW